MYAIAFDLDTTAMQTAYPGSSWQNGYGEIENGLAEFGFARQQGSVYFGSSEVTSVTCVLAVQHLRAAIPWFAASVRDIRMLRIEENNDLAPALAPPEGSPSNPQPVIDPRS